MVDASTLIGWQAVVPRLAIRRSGRDDFTLTARSSGTINRFQSTLWGVIMRLAIFVLLMASTAIAENATFQVQTADNEAEAHLSGTLKLMTEFGYAVVDVIKIDELHVKTRSTLTVSDGTVLRGEVDWSGVAIEPNENGIEAAEIVSLSAIRHAEPKPGETTTGRAANRLSYYLRAPQDYSSEKQWPALLLLHGSNMNAKSYVDSVVERWPDLAKTHLLVGINGERRTASSLGGSPRFNYTYVNFAGKSKYKGYPGTDRESPALVAELLSELRERLPIKHCYLIGHSQGGFLTYSVAMNYPELIDGAVPTSAGVIVQAVPSAYTDKSLIEQQKQLPIAIVHGTTDRTVSYNLAESALQAYQKAEYPKVKLFSHETAAHRFMLLPIDEAVAWLDEQRHDEG